MSTPLAGVYESSDTPKRLGLPKRTDVLVIGAGPTGLALACRLASRGIDHVIVDEAPEGASTSRAAVVHARTLELLEAVGVSDALIQHGVIVPYFTVRDGDRVLLELDFSALPSKYPFTLMIPQSVTESLLVERLASYGSRVVRPMTAVSVKQDGGEAIVQLVSSSPSENPLMSSVSARYVVACDGMHSRIRSVLGMPFVGSTYEETFVLADVVMDWSVSGSEGVLFFSEEGLLVVAPLPGGRHRIVATVEQADEHPALEVVQQLLVNRGPKASPARVRDIVWSGRFRVHHRMADHFRAGRVFLAGDAAHVHSPAGGQGMNTGIQDGLDLADRLAHILAAGPAAPERKVVLDRYEDDRKAVAASVLSLTSSLTTAATLKGRAAKLARNRSLRVLGHVPAFRRALTLRLAGIRGKPKARPWRKPLATRLLHFWG
jgi:2-polyprenyl-6-methoxyphenol hydroxylase-like FAD-dependent oxidoreductase